MKYKNWIKVGLLLFVGISMGVLVINGMTSKVAPVPNSAAPAKVESKQEEPDKNAKPNRLIIYYFHTTYRCHTCTLLEEYTKEAIQKKFSQELASGLIELKSIDVQEAGYEHYIQKYKLVTKSVVVSSIVNNQESNWKNLEEIWNLVQDKNAYFSYIADQVKPLLSQVKNNG